ncbi:hypothetical protein PAPYR_8105 [Paratrimastix pyriformis]|uniref:Uncharacterized protein n=1 Tax=Paratrimastix pyriformis TaxID=342808 RepID=A0ABQ8UCW6_9EUKA|nr:hypothetical protein PAPYR_8105 [Paratrimastix pyriformis]
MTEAPQQPGFVFPNLPKNAPLTANPEALAAMIDPGVLDRFVTSVSQNRNSMNAKIVAQQNQLTQFVQKLSPLAHQVASASWERSRDVMQQGPQIRLASFVSEECERLQALAESLRGQLVDLDRVLPP